MSFTKLQEAILAQAEGEVKDVTAHYREQIAREQARIQERAQTLVDAIEREAEATADTEARRLSQEHKLGAKTKVLTAKQTALHELEEATVAAILAWDATATKKLISQLMEQLPASSDGTIIAGEVHESVVRELAKSHKVSVAKETLPEDGGFIFRDTQAEIDLTVRALVRHIFNRHKAELAGLLFS